jgi:hypothetical protein
MGRKIKAKIANTGEIKEVDIDSLKTGPIRTTDFSDALLERIGVIHAIIKDVCCPNLEQFEVGFMHDANPEREVARWERIAVAYEKVKAAVPALDGKAIMRTLLLYSMGGLSAEEKAKPDVRKIVEIAEGE